MLRVRVIPCLDISEGRVVKGTEFKNLKDAGDPVERASFYNREGADELTFLDINATVENRSTVVNMLEQVSSQVFIPLTAGGGVRTVEDMKILLRAGADKVSLCSAVINNPEVVRQGAQAFGSQCIVVSIDARRDGSGSWAACTKGGRVNSGKNAIELAKEVEKLGAGEILLNSIDGDGSQSGYDLELTRKVAESVNIPVIASGGAGSPEHMAQAVIEGQASAVLAASILHYGKTTIKEIKNTILNKGGAVR